MYISQIYGIFTKIYSDSFGFSQLSKVDRRREILNTKRNRKQSVSKSLYLNYSTDVEKLLNSGEIPSIAILLDRYKTGLSVVQVIQIIIKNTIELDEKTNVLGEVMFEDALRQAALLDNYFDQTDGLIGILIK